MKKIALLIIYILFIYGCTTKPETTTSKEVIKELEILDQNFFIDINESTVKFLFKTLRGDLVNFYIGLDSNNLNKVQDLLPYKNKGLKVENLEAKKKYYYMIEVIRETETLKTDILSFTKQDRTNNWSHAEWGRSAIFYEVFVRSFNDSDDDGIGDLKGLEAKIPYLKELGVDALWLMPILQSPTYHGYDVTDYYNVEKDYGTNQNLFDLIKTAHKNDIKIVMDLVINHSSIDHPWFKDAVKGVDNTYRNYYDWADSTDRVTDNGPFGGKMWHKAYSGYYNAIFWDRMPDMNLRNKKVRDEFKDIATFWIENGIDGFRLDAALHIDDKDKDVTHSWWKEFNTHVKSINPNALLIGENWTSTAKMASYFNDLDSSFNFTFASSIEEFSRGDKVDLLNKIERIYDIYKRYNKKFIDSTFLTNHDQNRISSNLGGDLDKTKLAATILFTMPGTPFIYYGEELGQLGKKPDESLREPFDWYTETNGIGMTSMSTGGFNHSMDYTKPSDGISYQEQSGIDGSVLEHYKSLIKIRKKYKELFSIKNYKKVEYLDGLYVYKVETATSNLLIIHNNSDELKSIDITDKSTELLTNRELEVSEQLQIKSFTSAILEYSRD